ncbi:MAG: MFS transporter [Chloroflexota bacterium]|nr:MFS transporter [Chloroflexota bacterium]
MKDFAKSIYRWHPSPPFFYGWIVLGTASIGALIATSVAQTVFGGIQDLIAGEIGWDRKTIALAATLGTWTSGLTMPFIGKLVDKFGPRWMMFLASLVVGFGTIYFSNSHSLWQFFTAYIVVRAIAGPNLQNLIPRTVAVNFFEKKRNFAMGITSLNRIIGESINIQVITAIATTYSWRTAYKIIGLVSIPLSLPIFLLMRHKPEHVGQLPDGAAQTAADKAELRVSEKTWSVAKIMALPSFWFIMIGEFIAVTSTSMTLFQVVPFLTDGGISQNSAAAALTLGNVLGGLSVPAWGYLTDRLTTKKIAIFVLLLAIIPSVLFTIIDVSTYGFALVVFWTTITSLIFVLGSMMLGTVFNRASFGTVTGLTGPTRTAAMGLGPSVGAFTVAWIDSYIPIFIATSIGYFCVIFLYYNVRAVRTGSSQK